MPKAQADMATESESLKGKRSTAGSRLAVGLVLGATFVAYVGTLGFNFVYDDHEQIVMNPLLRSWKFVPYYFVHDVWSQRSLAEVTNYYRPIFLLWLRLNFALFGVTPFGWHLTTIFLHVLVTGLVYLLGKKIFKDRWRAGLAAAIFGLHPIHIEGAAWISGTTDPLMALFVIAAFLCYLKSRESGPRPRMWWAVSLLLYFLGTLAKETALALPLLVFGHEWIYGGEKRGGYFDRLKHSLRAVAPYLLLTGVYLALRVRALGTVGRSMTPLPWRVLFFTLPSVLWFYARMLVWPHGVSAFYDTPYILYPGLKNFLLPAAVMALIALGLCRWSRRSSEIAFASLWILFPLLPVLDLKVFGPGDIAHDRYLYLPSVGFALVGAFLLGRVRLAKPLIFGRPLSQVVLAAALLVWYGVGTVRQSIYWANDIVLFYRGMTIAPSNPYVRNNLGIAMMHRKQWGKAIALFHEAIDRSPDFADPYSNLGLLYYKIGDYRQAEQYTQKALEINSHDAATYFLLGVTRLELGHPKEAAELIRYALVLQPRAFGFHYALGVTLRKEEDFEGALQEFKAEPSDSPKQREAGQQISEIEALLNSHGEKRPQSGSPPGTIPPVAIPTTEMSHPH